MLFRGVQCSKCFEFGRIRGKNPQLCSFTGLSCPFWLNRTHTLIFQNKPCFLTHQLFGITHLESMFRLRRNQVCTNRNWESSQRKILRKNAGLFIKIYFFSRCFSHIFAIANQLAGFLHKTSLLLPHLSCNVEFELS